MALMEFSMIPLDKGASFSKYVARTLSILDQSGLDYRLNPMGTVVEGEWDELMALLTRCYRDLEKDSDRISLTVKFDCRKGVKCALEGKIKSVEGKAGREFKK
ncbi:MAG: thiamine-binding protein [Desulfobacteraceae bacterium]|nr:MAG: thiamine-binding protein [Desulfobacteraceae bacterium]